jgi:Do/DeqQ family serine protease
MRRTWLVFSQAVTVAVAVLFVVGVLKPEWLAGRDVRVPQVVSVATVPPAPAGSVSGVGYAAAARRASPAVVSITASRAGPRAPTDDPVFRHFFGDRAPRSRGEPQMGLGSGVIVSADGYLLTNNHVVDGASDIEVQLADGRQAQAKLIGTDPETDVAVLKITLERLPSITLGDVDQLQVGDVVLAIGNPFNVGQTVTSGIVSALGRNQLGINTFENFIQTDAAINPGNSGGALVDMAGRVVGINTAIYTKSGGSQGIGFAIPANLVKLVVESAATGRKLERPWLGAKLETVTRELAEGLKLGRVAGALVARLQNKGPAAEAGLQAGDVIVGVDGHEVDDARAVHYRLTTRGIGNRVQLDVVRKGSPAKVELALRAAPPGALDARDLSGAHPFDGARVANILPGTAEELGIDEEEGVAVVAVRPRTTAARLGFRPGDVILQVGRERIASVAELESALRQRQRGWLVVVKRGGQVLQLQLSG